MKKLTQLKTFEDACKLLGLDADKIVPDFSCYPEQDREAMLAHAKLVIITRAANRIGNNGEDWIPDWDNGRWDKYYPWFYMDGGSSGFRVDVYVNWRSLSYVGSRLCFVSRAAAEYVAEQFIDLYRAYFVI